MAAFATVYMFYEVVSIVALFGLIGTLVMKAVQGELDIVTDVLDRNRRPGG